MTFASYFCIPNLLFRIRLRVIPISTPNLLIAVCELLYLDQFWYRHLQKYFRLWRGYWLAFVLQRLVSNKEDRIWNAAVWQDDGEITKLLQEFEERNYLGVEGQLCPDMVDEEGGTRRCAEGCIEFDIAITVAKFHDVYYKNYANTIKDSLTRFFMRRRMTDIMDQLANTSRRPNKKERRQLQVRGDDIVSILWICIHRNHASDVDYLLRNANIDLRTRSFSSEETVLHKAVSTKTQQFVHSILETNSSVSPLGCLELGDDMSETPLHTVIKTYLDDTREGTPEESHMIIGIAKLLLEHGANVNALNIGYETPLHLLLGWRNYRSFPIVPLLEELLSKSAEVNSRDSEGCSPLHLACQKQDTQAILLLVKEGADLEALDDNRRTPRSYLKTTENYKHFLRDLEILARTSFSKRERRMKLPDRDHKISNRQMQICEEFPVYCRFQRNTKVTATKGDVILNWVGTDQNVFDVLYSNNGQRVATFLQDCETKAESVWEVVRNQLDTVPMSSREETHKDAQAHHDTWRWVSFPANNDFILDHIDNLTSHDTKMAMWEFLQDNIKVRDTKENISRIRAPHAKQMGNHGPKRRADSDDMSQAEPMVSIVIPYLDIEANYFLKKKARDEEAYLPFTGIDGVQMPQTLDQTFNSSEMLSGLRSKENQVIYRWCVKQASKRVSQLSNTWRRPWDSAHAGFRESWLYWQGRRRYTEPDLDTAPFTTPVQVATDEPPGNITKMQIIQRENLPKWLMVRQLWLWKLHDGTILTAIPSRKIRCMADDLLETIRHSELDEISTSDDLMKHIVQQTVTFTERFRLAGVGEHILDIFENELASEMDKEAGFFNNFTRKDWNSIYVNIAISEAAGCTWRVKDIRGELRLIDKVFTQQLDVLKEFAAVIATDNGMSLEEQEATLIRESGLEVLRERIRRIDEDAATTIDGLSNITQAMLAQASLKEAESARLMNFIILPFTVVTVIFTPLSFMTSLFAVNSDGFPHNDEGELRIPSNWLRDKMIIGEIGTLIPLLIIIVSISYLRTGTRRTPKEQPK
ncbi:hypothetical protein FPOA_00085 [Fusarium poae]|uniref:Uncharacterized protein n=1 Tax=Fusarium poae TaxID=36050 RepID=A0A1B8B0B3_FUSPO|nr:hypothetical protein FPOA_00085 [Fusarium poae]